MSAPLSFGQESLYLSSRIAPDLTYLLTNHWRINGPIDTDALASAVDSLIERHEILRTAIEEVKGRLSQRVMPAPAGVLRRIDAVSTDPALALPHDPVDLARPPLIRATLRSTAADQHLLTVSVHHIAADGRSLEILWSELSELYRAAVDGRPPQLTELPLDYVDYASWQREDPGTQDAEVAFWEERLAGTTAVRLPRDRAVPDGAVLYATSLRVELEPGFADTVRASAAALGVTPFVLWCTALATVLGELGPEPDVLFGTIAAGRDEPELDQLVGYFANPVPVRVPARPADPFRAGVARMRSALADAFAHHAVPTSRLGRSASGRDPGRHPLFQTLIQSVGDMAELDLGPVTATWAPDTQSIPTEFDLQIDVHEAGRTPHLVAYYCSELTDRATVVGWLEALLTVLTEGIESPDQPAGRATPAMPNQGAELLSGGAPCAPETSVPALLTPIWEQAPDRHAIAFGDEHWTYRQLRSRAAHYARRLRAAGLERGDVAGVQLERGPELVAALLGVWLAGGTYTVLDPHQPEERRRYVIADSAMTCLIRSPADTAGPEPATGGAEPATGGAGPAIVAVPPRDRPDQWGEEPFGCPDPGELAYLCYTSGSTGRPKGVAVEHHSLASFGAWYVEEFGLRASDRAAFTCAPAFDVAGAEIWATLIAGAELVMPADEVPLGAELRDWLIEHRVTVTSLVTPLADTVLGLEWPPDVPLRTMVVAGDRLLARNWTALPFTVVNAYGPTEATIYATSGVVPRNRTAPPSIGRVRPGLVAVVRDEAGRPVPENGVGELLLGGPGLARGYHGRPDLTADRFVRSPELTSDGVDRLYRTGDLVRLGPGGELEFQGRIDDQVKIRGFRVEPAEAAARLSALPGVQEAVVTVDRRDPTDLRLLGYAVAAPGQDRAPDDLRAALRAELPDYLVPHQVIVLDSFPVTANGKVDRAALPLPERQVAVAPAAAEDLVELIRGLVAEVLGRPSVAATDDFFALGGHSLLALRLGARIAAETGREVSLHTIFLAPTAAALAAAIGGSTGSAAGTTTPRRSRPARLPLSPEQTQMWLIDRLADDPAGKNVAVAMRVTGALDVSALSAAVSDLGRHEILRTVYPLGDDGLPYQRILPPEAGPRLEVRELTGPSAVQAIHTVAASSFDLAAEIPLRIVLLRARHESYLVVAVHHIATDEAGLGLLLADLGAGYRQRIGGNTAPRPAPAVQYSDYALASEETRHENERVDLAYWSGRLAGALPGVLPHRPGHDGRAERPGRDGGAEPAAGVRCESVTLPVSKDLAAAVSRSVRAAATTMFVFLHAALAKAVARTAGASEVQIGTPVSRRTGEERAEALGCFLNTIVLRTDVSGNPSARELLDRVRSGTAEAFAHASTPYVEVVRAVNPVRRAGAQGLFQVLHVHHRSATVPLDLPDCTVEVIDLPSIDIDADVQVSTVDLGATALEFAITYRADRIEGAVMRTLARHFADGISELANDSDPAELGPTAAGEPTQDPRGGLEQQLAEAFAEVTGATTVRSDDDFFAIGGHSLSAVRLLDRIERTTGRAVRLRDLVTAPTVAGLASLLTADGVGRGEPADAAPARGQESAGSLSPVLELRRGTAAGTIVCLHPAGGLGWCYADLAARLPTDATVIALQAPDLRPGAVPARSVDEMADAYVRTLLEHGLDLPAHLVGWSFGGVVAQAMAVRLGELGIGTASLTMLDSQLRLHSIDSTETAHNLIADAWSVPVSAVADAVGSPAELASMTAVVRNDLRLLHGHVPRVHRGRTLLVGAAGTDAGLLSAWSPYLQGQVHTATIPEGHEAMLREPALSRTAELIARQLSYLP